MWRPPAPLWSCLIKSASWPATVKTSRLGIHSCCLGSRSPQEACRAHSRGDGFLGTGKAVGTAISQVSWGPNSVTQQSWGLGKVALPTEPEFLPVCENGPSLQPGCFPHIPPRLVLSSSPNLPFSAHLWPSVPDAVNSLPVDLGSPEKPPSGYPLGQCRVARSGDGGKEG